MGLLFSEDIKNQLVHELANTSSSLCIVSAYCKLDAIRFVEESLRNNISSKRLMVRFRLDDIVNGSSDLNVYEYCKQKDWQVFFRFDLHAKTYVFDKIRGIVGSANLTSRGIGLSKSANYEIAQLSSISNDDMNRIESLFDNAVMMTDNLYAQMQQCVKESISVQKSKSHQWVPEIMNLFTPELKVLFVHEFPNCPSLSNLREDSLDFLGLESGWDVDNIRKAFIKSNVYMWLKQMLRKMPEQEIYYGALSATLHDIIINDPKPYRKEVKQLQTNLLNWIEELGIDEIIIERPNHSQRIRLEVATHC